MKNAAFTFIVILFGMSSMNSQSNLGASSGFFANKDVGALSNTVTTNDHHLLTYYVKSQVFGIGDDDPKIKGSLFLFDNWKNTGVIEIGETSYTLSNVNFHIENEEFMSKLQGDSIMVFDSSYLDKIVINNRAFKSVFNSSEGKDKIYEVILETPNLSLLKGYIVTVTLGSPNPMVNRPSDEIKRKSKYYILKNKQLTTVKLNKKTVIGLVDQHEVKKLQEFVKRKKLSYKKEKDVAKMFAHLLN